VIRGGASHRSLQCSLLADPPMHRRFPLLLRRGKLWSRESLPSFLVRLAQLNFYDPVTMMNWLCLEGTETDRLDWPSKGETYERLFELCWIDSYALHDATGHYFAGRLTPPGVEIASLQVPNGGILPILPPELARKHLRPSSAAQFCPMCLKEAPYHRVRWMPIAAAVCIRHKRLLVDRCPECQGRVPIRAIVEDCRCRRCGTDLRQARSPWIADDSFGLDAQRFVQWWLGIGRKPADPGRYGPLPQLSARLLLYLSKGVVESIRLRGSDWSYMHRPVTPSTLEPFDGVGGRPTPDQSYRLHATAFKALVDWPQGFHEFLQAYAARDDRRVWSGVSEDLGRLYARWLDDRWKNPVFSFVQDAFARHLVNTYVTSPSAARQGDGCSTSNASPALAFISTIRAARLLEVDVGTIKRLTDAGFLIKYTLAQGEPRRYGAVRRDEVLTLRLAWRKGISLEDAARWLGLTKSIVVDLVRVGLLTAEHGPDEDGCRQWTFSKQNLDRCYGEVAKGVRTHGPAYSSLAEAARTLAGLGLKVADILKLVADGKLQAWSCTPSPALAKLSFGFSDIDALLQGPELGKELLNSEKVAHRLGVESWTFFRWVIAGLFSPVVRYAYEEYFDPDEIEGFLAEHISSKEAAGALGVEVAELEGWFWEWGLEAVTGTGVDGLAIYLFRREDVKRLKSERAASD
jgi:hypothetical protein